MRCLWQNSLMALGSLMAAGVEAQTYSSCNPLNSNSCPADTALGMTINVDFTNGAVNSFSASGSPTYDKTNGVSFTVSKGGDAPQIQSLFYIMFGRVEVTMKAAPGAGIVSSLVLESDVLDEIDIEWLGSDADEVQSNYFGKGQVTSYNRGQFHDLTGTQSKWITYTVDWTKDKIVWMADGTILRSMTEAQAESGQYPQTPMRVKLGAWAGGDPNYNAAGTVKWARGPTDYTKGPFSMMVKKLVVTDYSTGKQYKYGDTTGDWESIQAVDGKVNGNINNKNAVTATATAVGSVSTGVGIPVGGIGTDKAATSTQSVWPWATATTGAIPSGWYMNSEGKILRENTGSGSSVKPPALLCLLLTPALGALLLVMRLL
ncbi:unnamed protein product [Clonostachys rosea]|uniref:GH16 domain-containing protein n=1 Tax=Bionectria ochroleuca TaxID=29856 RepID=A0ABY6UER9_BIOOC|nr:unnamed protein product [Clonostachys rosea]